VIFNLACSFHSDEAGLVHQQQMPKVKGPDELEPLAKLLADHPESVMTSFLRADGLDIRYVSALPWEKRQAPGERQQLWLRTSARLSDDPLLHAAFATLVSDLTLVDTILSWHGYSPWDDAFVGASLDHCMWFHRPLRADEWLFYDQQSPTAYGARGLAFGSLYTESGNLVASVAQEGLIRIRSGT
jgi:acyl-CoA thioesterase-2